MEKNAKESQSTLSPFEERKQTSAPRITQHKGHRMNNGIIISSSSSSSLRFARLSNFQRKKKRPAEVSPPFNTIKKKPPVCEVVSWTQRKKEKNSNSCALSPSLVNDEKM